MVLDTSVVIEILTGGSDEDLPEKAIERARRVCSGSQSGNYVAHQR